MGLDNTTNAKGDLLLKDYSPAEIGSFGNPVESAQGDSADPFPPGGGLDGSDSTGGGNQNEPHTLVSSPLPLTLEKGTDVDDIQIIPGYVNLEMPTLGGTALNQATPPEITVTADVWVWLKCVGTFGSPDTYVVTVETTTTATAPTGTTITATGFISFRPLGSVDFTAGSPATYDITNVHSGGNFGVDSFGNINLWWKA